MTNTNDIFNLGGRVAVVTGALGLIGRNHCLALLESGATVVGADLSTERPPMDAALAERYLPLHLNLTDADSINALHHEVLSRYGKVDILVNNAAMNDMVENASSAHDTAFEVFPMELFRRVIDVNVSGLVHISQVIGTEMARRGKGSIINIASTYGIVAPDQSIYRDEQGRQFMYKSAAYPVSKGAVIQFTRFLAAYWGHRGVRVNTLSPGGVENGQIAAFVDAYSKKTPLQRMARPTDYKGALVFLASDASEYMTGANLVVDGGWTCW